MSLNLTYVHSAPNYLRIMPARLSKESPEKNALMTSAITEGLQWVRDKCREIMHDRTLKNGLLFNAYTESRHGAYFKTQRNFDFDQIYADSGGLQVVTTGKKLTSALKEEVYKVQKTADFGFCFDEIPLGIKEGVDQETGKHRSQTESKLFDPSGFKACAEHTAKNVLNQTRAFEGSATKAFYILQGNTQEEMYQWFETGVDIIGEHGFDRIQGVAPADTCMGNGPLESADMMAAYHRIINDFGPHYAKQHLHLLGVGSPSRLLPAIFLKRSGFLPADMELSFDSSSSSMSYAMGNFIDSDGSRPNKNHVRVMRMFSTFYDDLGGILERYSPGLTKEWFMAHTEAHYMSISNTVKECPAEFEVAIRASITLMCIWQNVGFYARLKKDMECDETRQSGIGFLAEVKDMNDYNHWIRTFSHGIKSCRIDRKKEFTLDSLFE